MPPSKKRENGLSIFSFLIKLLARKEREGGAFYTFLSRRRKGEGRGRGRRRGGGAVWSVYGQRGRGVNLHCYITSQS